MRIIRSCLSLLVVVVSFISCQSGTNDNSKVDQTFAKNLTLKVDSIGQMFIDQNQTIGLSIAIAQNGEVIYSNGFGFIDSTKTKKVNSDNMFLLASISKLVGASMIMKLEEEDKLSLDNTLAELLPEFPNSDQAEKINLRQLLDHTSGLKDYATVIDSVYMMTRVNPTVSDYYAFFQDRLLDFEPSTHFNYSNSGYILMAEIIENVTGNTFEQELDRIINLPSGLNLKLIKDNITNPKLTSIFELNDSIFNFQQHWTWIKGDGGLTTTASELALFPFFWSNGTIISKEAFKKQCSPTVLKDGISTDYGIGVRTGRFEGEPVVGHTGGNKTTMATMKFFPEKELSIVVFVNTDNTSTDALYIAGYVTLAALDIGEPDLNEIEVKSADLTRFLGSYKSTDNYYYGQGNISVVSYDGEPNIYRKRPNSDSKGQKLYYLGNNEFGYEPYPMDRIIFQANENGEIVAFNNYWNGLRKGGLYRKQ